MPIISDDFTDGLMTGIVTITANTATFTRTLTSDLTTDGSEAFIAALSYFGDLVATSTLVTVNDTSIASGPPGATYALSRSAANVNEGSSVTITLTTTNVTNGTTVPYTITGTGITTADINGASLTGDFTINSGTADLVINVSEDLTAEAAETLTVSAGGQTINVIINLSTAPAVTVANPVTGWSNTVFENGDINNGGVWGSNHLTINPDGTWTVVGDSRVGSLGTLYNGSGNWATPTTVGIGSQYWVRVTLTDFFPDPNGDFWYYGTAGYHTASDSGWTSLSMAATVITVGLTSGGQIRATYTIEIATNSSGTNIVSTSNNVWFHASAGPHE